MGLAVGFLVLFYVFSIESLSGLGGKRTLKVTLFQAPAMGPSTRPGCSEPRPAWPWTHPGCVCVTVWIVVGPVKNQAIVQ